jgi:hypothetical protein
MLTVVVRAFFPKAVAAVQESLGQDPANDQNPVNVQNLVNVQNPVNSQGLIGEKVLKNQGSERNLAGKGTASACEIAGKGDSAAISDPTWRMLVPLIIFCIVIIGIGVYSAPLMKLLYAIGGEVG